MAKEKKEKEKKPSKKKEEKSKKESKSSSKSDTKKTEKLPEPKNEPAKSSPAVEKKAEKVVEKKVEAPKSPKSEPKIVEKKAEKPVEKKEEAPKKKEKAGDVKRIGYEDMTTMENMTLEGVLENLRARYVEDLVYTYTSSILVAINPYKRLPIYTDRIVKQYKGVRLGLLPPHIFAIAETAYTSMIQHEKNQSVLVSGESGAGKTESTKLILQFLSARTDRTSNIEKMVLASVPVLEAMGNAKTGRNDNSSRFGKLIKIQFDQDYYITGSTMSTYLLEKSRLIYQSAGERNFHVFYQMTMGMTKEEKERYFFKEPEFYNYINKSGCYTVSGVDERESLQEFRDALKLFDINEELEDHMFRVLATVLHLGNISYKDKGEGCELLNAESEEQLKICSTLLSLNQADLLFALSHKEIKMRNELINKPLTADQAKDQTDALAKYLYNVLFDWLVMQLNSCTHAEEFRSFIGVLDIFGFEVFEKNLLEQFLINYANEKLQQFFNHQIFKLEQKIYEEEKIDWTVIEFKDNQECLDLIEQRRPPGLLSILDEECKFPRATDETLIAKLHDNFFKKHAYYDKPRLAQHNFIVKHFAGEVNYYTVGWRDKNKDELPSHLSKTIASSTNMFVAILYSSEEEAPSGGAGGAGGDKGAGKPVAKGPSGPSIKLNLSNASPGKKNEDLAGLGGGLANMQGAGAKGVGKETVGMQFKNQLLDLMELLSATEPYFIRCVKPNPQKIPNNFDQELIYNQLLYAGMLETIRIRRMGYPIRHPHDDFFKRFRVICPEVARTQDVKESVTALIKALGLNIPYQTQIGTTKIFLKQETANELEDRRNHSLTHIIKVLQKWWLSVWTRANFIEQRQNAVVIERWFRTTTKRSMFLRKRSGAGLIQQWYKQARAVRLLAFLREKKRKEEEERKRREEEERKKAIAKYGKEKVEQEEALRKKLEAEKDDAEKEKIRRLLAGEDEVKVEEEGEKKKKKKKKKTRLARSGSILMDKNEVVEVPINVDGRLTVGLGWKGKNFEMDASCLMFRYRQHHDDVYKFKPRSKDGAVVHKVGWSGSLSLINTIGGEGSDQHQIDINLNRLTDKVNTLIFIVTLFTQGTNFSDIQDTYLRLIDSSTKKEHCRYNIESSGKETAKIMCKLFRYGYSSWRLKAIGHPSQGRLYKHMISKVNAFLDPLPPKRKFRITIHKVKIVKSSSSKANLDANAISTFCQLRFDLTSHKTRVVKRSLEPTFNSNFDVEGHASAIEVSLMQKRGFAKQSLMARAVILVIDNMKHNEEWFTFEDEETAQCGGQVKLSIDDL